MKAGAFTVRNIGGFRRVTCDEQQQFGPDLRYRFQVHFNEELPGGGSSFCGGLKRNEQGQWIAAPWPATPTSIYGAPADFRIEAVRNCISLALAQAGIEPMQPASQPAGPPPTPAAVVSAALKKNGDSPWYVQTIKDSGLELLTTLADLLTEESAENYKPGPKASAAVLLVTRVLADAQANEKAALAHIKQLSKAN